MKVYDCFTFYNEFELLELRLKALWDVTDYFVIVEGNRTFTGKPKDFNLFKRKDDFKDFFPKIRHISVDLSKVPFKGTGDWSIEFAQRNAIIYGLDNAQPDDLIMISDVDEIPAPDIFRRLQDNRIALIDPAVIPSTLADRKIFCPAQLLIPAKNFLEIGAIVMNQKFLYYYFDRITKTFWQGTILVKRKNLSTPQALRNLRMRLPRVTDGGYHFSYMGGVERVIDKMNSVVDGNEYVVKSGGKFGERKYIEEHIEDGSYVSGILNSSELQAVPFEAGNITLPHIDEFLRKYPNFLHEPKKYFGDNY